MNCIGIMLLLLLVFFFYFLSVNKNIEIINEEEEQKERRYIRVYFNTMKVIFIYCVVLLFFGTCGYVQNISLNLL